jgi:hypothetical protein
VRSGQLILSSATWRLCTLSLAGSPTNGVTFQVNCVCFTAVPCHSQSTCSPLLHRRYGLQHTMEDVQASSMSMLLL